MAASEPKSVLIIEDDEVIRTTVADFLRLEGYDVFKAENGREALEILKSFGLPNLILLDMRMPVMDGWKFAAKFLEGYDCLCPIVVMTAAPDAEQRAKEIHAAGWMGKPFDLNELLGLVKKLER